MAIWYVNSLATGLNNGTSKADAWTTLGAAFTGVTVAGDPIWISHLHAETLSTSTTYTPAAAHNHANPLVIQCRNFTTDALATGATLLLGSANMSVMFAGAYRAHRVHGLRIVGTGNYTYQIYLAYTAGSVGEYTNCEIDITTCLGTSAGVILGLAGSISVSKCITRGLTIKWGATGQCLAMHSNWQSYGDNFSAGTVHPTKLITYLNYCSGYAVLYGSDLSNIATITDMNDATDSPMYLRLFNPKLKAGFVMMATPVADTSHHGFVEMFDGDAGDNHYAYGYADSRGTLLCDTGVYANDNICDTSLSWKLTTTAHASVHNPFVTPLISIRHTGVAAIIPYLECLRSGSTTAYTDAQLWARWGYKGTNASTRTTIVDDRCALDATPTAQASSSKTAADWTGEHASLNWFGKLDTLTSITPAEAGDLGVQIGFGVASSTVYVDPQIRGLM